VLIELAEGSAGRGRTPVEDGRGDGFGLRRNHSHDQQKISYFFWPRQVDVQLGRLRNNLHVGRAGRELEVQHGRRILEVLGGTVWIPVTWAPLDVEQRAIDGAVGQVSGSQRIDIGAGAFGLGSDAAGDREG